MSKSVRNKLFSFYDEYVQSTGYVRTLWLSENMDGHKDVFYYHTDGDRRNIQYEAYATFLMIYDREQNV